MVSMRAMLLHEKFDLSETRAPLMIYDLPIPQINDKQVLIKINTCGVCYSEINLIEGHTNPPDYPIIPGHQVVGIIEEKGSEVKHFNIGDRVGIGWISYTCGKCEACLSGMEDQCINLKVVGLNVHGGYADYIAVNEDVVFAIPQSISDTDAAPLLCAGAIGYKSIFLANPKIGSNIGIIGYNCNTQIILDILTLKDYKANIFVFASNKKELELAQTGKYKWVGTTNDEPTDKLDAIIDTSYNNINYEALKRYLNTSGKFIINSIKQTLLQSLKSIDTKAIQSDYAVAIVNRKDIHNFLTIATDINLKVKYKTYHLEEANKAIHDLLSGKDTAFKVLKINDNY